MAPTVELANGLTRRIEVRLSAPCSRLINSGVADWFILNAREAGWEVGQFGAFLSFRESDGTRFEQVGVNIAVLGP
jgi:hypothetical protein